MPAAAKSKRPKPGSAKTSAARKRAAPDVLLVGALAEAAWAEADAALSEALADFDELTTAGDAEAREQAMAMLAQSLARAARRRGLTRVGVLGASVAYDPERHELVAAGAKKPKTVHIKARGVARGADTLVKPRAGPSGRKKRS